MAFRGFDESYDYVNGSFDDSGKIRVSFYDEESYILSVIEEAINDDMMLLLI